MTTLELWQPPMIVEDDTWKPPVVDGPLSPSPSPPSLHFQAEIDVHHEHQKKQTRLFVVDGKIRYRDADRPDSTARGGHGGQAQILSDTDKTQQPATPNRKAE